MLASLWVVLAILTSVVGVLEYEDKSLTANLLRVAIVMLMVVTAFLLVRYDLTRRK